MEAGSHPYFFFKKKHPKQLLASQGDQGFAVITLSFNSRPCLDAAQHVQARSLSANYFLVVSHKKCQTDFWLALSTTYHFARLITMFPAVRCLNMGESSQDMVGVSYLKLSQAVT